MGKDNTYMERTVDFKKIWLLYWQRVWLVVVITIAAAGIGAGVYNVVRALNSEGELYRVSSDYYITFNEDEVVIGVEDAFDGDEVKEVNKYFEDKYDAKVNIGVVSNIVKKELVKNAIFAVALALLGIIF